MAVNFAPSTKKESARKSVACPLSASGAYQLAMKVCSSLQEVYSDLLKSCQDPVCQEVLEQFSQEQTQELEIMNKHFLYALNAELTRFYDSGGLLMETDEVKNQLEEPYSVIIHNLENFYRELDSLLTIAKNTPGTAHRFFDIGNPAELYLLCIELRQNLADMCERLSRLYPSQDINKAFADVEVLILQGNTRLRRLANAHLV
jgi:hypothetical protein